jgi:tetratricopeptide (TPR) repeat protein
MHSIVLALLCAAMFSGQQSNLDQAWRLAANGQRGEAIHVLQSLIVTEPRNTDARLLLGSLLMEEGDKPSSLAQLKTAVEQRPRSEEAQNALGEAYNKFGETAAAKTAFEKAVAIKPDYGVGQLNLGQVLFAQGDLVGAAKHLDRALCWGKQTMRPTRIISVPGLTQRKTARVLPPLSSRQRSACVRALREPGLTLGRSVRSYWMILARSRHLNMPLRRIRTMRLLNIGLAPSTCIKAKTSLRSTTFEKPTS